MLTTRCVSCLISWLTARSRWMLSPAAVIPTGANCVKRLLSYVVVIRPLVMRAVAKSETLALSMELKGFGSNTYKNMPREPLGAADFIVLGLVVVLSTIRSGNDARLKI